MTQALYRHTQVGWPIRIAFSVGAMVVAVFVAIAHETARFSPAASFYYVVPAGMALVLLFGWIWGSLPVTLEGEQLRLWFGPGFPRKTIALAEIAGVKPTRTTFWNGWGIHRTRRGWLYNVSGFDTVEINLKTGKSVLIGTDEPRQLAAAIVRATQ